MNYFSTDEQGRYTGRFEENQYVSSVAFDIVFDYIYKSHRGEKPEVGEVFKIVIDDILNNRVKEFKLEEMFE